MRIRVKKSEYLQGDVTLPGSKSEAVRALIFALLARGTTHLHNLPQGEDIQDALRVAQSLGANIHQSGGILSLTSLGIPFHSLAAHIETGNSGLTARFILPLIGLRAQCDLPVTLDCGEQMRARPMQSLFEALNNVGMKISCLGQTDNFPIQITGKLMGGKTSVSGVTSQYLSALLIALPLAPAPSEITVENLHERPYVDMTLAWLKRLGIDFSHEKNEMRDIFIIPANQEYHAFEYTVPGDFSSASYLIAAGVMFPGEVILNGLNLDEAQGDKQLIDIVKSMGADIECSDAHIVIKGGKPLIGIQVDANAIPDLLPTLAVLGTFASGQTHITNVPQARLKETDRIASMADGLRKLGGKVIEQADGLMIENSALKGNCVESFGDHRTAMAMTLAGLLAEGETHINDGEAINKTYPDFINDMKKLGARLEVSHD